MSNKELIISLQNQIENLNYQDGNLDQVLKRSKMLIKRIFGEKSEYLKDLNRISFSPFIFTNNTPDSAWEDSFYEGKGIFLNLINIMLEEIALDEISTPENNPNVIATNYNNKKVFIVHGHNEEMKQSIARTLDKIHLEPIILHEQPSQGKTIIEKFTHYSDVGYAIVILSADDVAYPKADDGKNPEYRARQNVILELGYFLGKLGREKVLAIHEDNIKLDIPSDYQGVLFVPYDKNGSWRYTMVKELKASGYSIDANEII